MAFCSYCGTKLDENAKFCTACGAKAEQETPVQEPAPVQSYTPSAADESVPVQGSYTAPTQGSYTSPTQGSYTAPQQGTYIPAQSYDPVQQPTSAAADSGSYVPPAQGYAPGTSYAPKAKAKMPSTPKGPAGKKRLATLGGIALAVILLIVLVSSCGGGGGAASDDPNLGVYNAVTAEMWGMEMPITDMFENGVSIELKEKGKCEMNIDGTTGKGTWTLEDGVFSAEAGGAELNGTLEKGVLYAENVLDMGVNLTFEKEGGYVEPVPDASGAVSGDSGEAVQSDEESALQQQWNGTWYGAMYVYEAEGDFADIPSDVYDVYMVVDVDEEGSGEFEVYFAGVDEPYAVGECNAMDYGMDAQSGTIVDMVDMDTHNWMFRPVPDYPDRYTVTDSIEYEDSLFEYSLFFKHWGTSWQDEIDSNFEIVPPSVEEYENAIANGELPPVGFAPTAYAGQVPAADDIAEAGAQVVECPSVWYGWMSFTEFDGIEYDDEMHAAWAYVDKDADGNTFFEVYQDGFPDNSFMSMYAEIAGNKIIPAIGDEDAWVSDTYLLEENADQYEGVLGEDGVLRFDYFFIHHSREYGYRVQMNFRVDGTEWDEDNDILPPRYDEYKAALAGGTPVESQPAQQEAPAEPAAAPTGFGGEHTATLAEFMTDITADFTFTLP